jgi:hypothetical protein
MEMIYDPFHNYLDDVSHERERERERERDDDFVLLDL